MKPRNRTNQITMCGNMCASMCRQNVQKWGTSKYTKQSKKMAYFQEVRPCKTTLLDGNHPFWDLAENVLKQIEQFPTDTQEGCVIHTGMLVLWQGGQIAAVRLKTLDRAEEVVVMIGALHLSWATAGGRTRAQAHGGGSSKHQHEKTSHQPS